MTDQQWALDALNNEADSMRQRIEAIERLHSKRTFHGDGYGWSLCAEDRQAWPCATVTAINSLYPSRIQHEDAS